MKEILRAHDTLLCEVSIHINKFKNLKSNSIDRKYICIGDTATLGYAEWDVASFFEDLITRLKNEGQKIIFVDDTTLNHQKRQEHLYYLET